MPTRSNTATNPSRIKRWLSGDTGRIATAGVLLGVVATGYFYRIGYTNLLTDQNAHLNFARMVTDSRTPGLSQLGFWPPLLHILMAPFAAVRFLYDTGLAAAGVLITALSAGAVFLYHLARHLTGRPALGFAAAASFLVNPYILYYSATPMMEVLFLACLLGTAYFLLRWLTEMRIAWLLWAAFFSALTGLARFEGLATLPLLGIIIIVALRRRKKTYPEIESTLLLFGLLAGTGLAFLVGYSWYFSGSPFIFSSADWARDPRLALRLTEGSISRSLEYLAYASAYMLSWPLVLAGVGALPLVAAISSKQRFAALAVLLVVASPALFVLFGLFTGSTVILVPDLPPYTAFHNERYGLTWIGLAILAPLCAAGSLTVRRPRQWGILSTGVAVLLVAISGTHTYRTFAVTRFESLRHNLGTLQPADAELHAYFRASYDYGNVLLNRLVYDRVLTTANLPLSHYITEGNYPYFSPALENPWLYARWVVMLNEDEIADRYTASDQIHKRWSASPVFERYYEVVFKNQRHKLYRLRESEVRAMAEAQGYDPARLPSLQPTANTWPPGANFRP
jgi:hypothetical protein